MNKIFMFLIMILVSSIALAEGTEPGFTFSFDVIAITALVLGALKLTRDICDYIYKKTNKPGAGKVLNIVGKITGLVSKLYDFFTNNTVPKE